ncbi:hypothetical protein I3271_09280 [Photobacterium leiognathi]|uniref:hypothetical protein n=1 Tax=Photobacterium leiognathi TaxID=553611 RepID=UPI001EDF9C6A|nr:hypothetical protein [Photobacterium leiognathi]MCG3884880.1 hypothetical protein [Photobacterium leiognathi]
MQFNDILGTTHQIITEAGKFACSISIDRKALSSLINVQDEETVEFISERIEETLLKLKPVDEHKQYLKESLACAVSDDYGIISVIDSKLDHVIESIVRFQKLNVAFSMYSPLDQKLLINEETYCDIVREITETIYPCDTEITKEYLAEKFSMGWSPLTSISCLASFYNQRAFEKNIQGECEKLLRPQAN